MDEQKMRAQVLHVQVERQGLFWHWWVVTPTFELLRGTAFRHRRAMSEATAQIERWRAEHPKAGY